MECVLSKKLPNEVDIKLEVLNAKEIKLIANKVPYEIVTHPSTQDILEISYPTLHINTESVIEFKVVNMLHNYRVRNISKVNDTTFILSSSKSNKTTHFILPMLGKNKTFFSCNKYLVNAYIRTTNNPSNDYIYLLYRYFPSEIYKELEYNLKQHSMYQGTEDIDFNFVLMKFKIPEEYKKDIQMFIEGSYSKFSGKLKNSIVNFHNLSLLGQTYQVLYKDDRRRKQLELEFGVPIHNDLELFDIPNLWEETFVVQRDCNKNLKEYSNFIEF